MVRRVHVRVLLIVAIRLLSSLLVLHGSHGGGALGTKLCYCVDEIQRRGGEISSKENQNVR